MNSWKTLVVSDSYAPLPLVLFGVLAGAEDSIPQDANLPVGLFGELHVICQFLSSAITEDFE